MARCSSRSNSEKFLVLAYFSFWRSCSVAAAIAGEFIWMKYMTYTKFWPKENFSLSCAENRKIKISFVTLSQRSWSRVVRQGSRFIVSIREDFRVVQSTAANTKAVLFTLLFVFFLFCFLRRRRRAPWDLPSARGTYARPPILVLPRESVVVPAVARAYSSPILCKFSRDVAHLV